MFNNLFTQIKPTRGKYHTLCAQYLRLRLLFRSHTAPLKKCGETSSLNPRSNRIASMPAAPYGVACMPRGVAINAPPGFRCSTSRCSFAQYSTKLYTLLPQCRNMRSKRMSGVSASTPARVTRCVGTFNRGKTASASSTTRLSLAYFLLLDHVGDGALHPLFVHCRPELAVVLKQHGRNRILFYCSYYNNSNLLVVFRIRLPRHKRRS